MAIGGAAPATAGTPLILTQTECPIVSGACAVLTSNDEQVVVRSYTFTLPAAGRAAITFESSLSCTNSGIDSTQGSINVGGQILQSATQSVSPTGSSFVRISGLLPPGNLTDTETSYGFPVQISTTRVISYPSGGAKTVVFKLQNADMSADTRCAAYTGSFNVLFVPDV